MVLSRIGFHSSRCTREVPHLPGPVRRSTSHSASALPTTVPGWPFIPSQLWNWPTFPVSPGRARCQTTAWDLFPLVPFLLAAWPALDYLHLASLPFPLSLAHPTAVRISSHRVLSSFPEGPCSASNSILFYYSSGRKHHPSFSQASFSTPFPVYLSLPSPHFSFSLTSLPSFSPYYSFVSSFSSSYSPHNYFPVVVKLIL